MGWPSSDYPTSLYFGYFRPGFRDQEQYNNITIPRADQVRTRRPRSRCRSVNLYAVNGNSLTTNPTYSTIWHRRHIWLVEVQSFYVVLDMSRGPKVHDDKIFNSR